MALSTTNKANVGGVVTAVSTLLLFAVARYTGLIAPPADEAVALAVNDVVLAIANGIIAWLGVYFAPKNTE